MPPWCPGAVRGHVSGNSFLEDEGGARNLPKKTLTLAQDGSAREMSRQQGHQEVEEDLEEAGLQVDLDHRERGGELPG